MKNRQSLFTIIITLLIITIVGCSKTGKIENTENEIYMSSGIDSSSLEVTIEKEETKTVETSREHITVETSREHITIETSRETITEKETLIEEETILEKEYETEMQTSKVEETTPYKETVQKETTTKKQNTTTKETSKKEETTTEKETIYNGYYEENGKKYPVIEGTIYPEWWYDIPIPEIPEENSYTEVDEWYKELIFSGLDAKRKRKNSNSMTLERNEYLDEFAQIQANIMAMDSWPSHAAHSCECFIMGSESCIGVFSPYSYTSNPDPQSYCSFSFMYDYYGTKEGYKMSLDYYKALLHNATAGEILVHCTSMYEEDRKYVGIGLACDSHGSLIICVVATEYAGDIKESAEKIIPLFKEFAVRYEPLNDDERKLMKDDMNQRYDEWCSLVTAPGYDEDGYPCYIDNYGKPFSTYLREYSEYWKIS
ncbi:MAG: hypothetical protein E7266_08030 [Lachnospiraceae bacterium]|nr:hypothetical protein [Lachnospiraceae bacterium]